MNIEKTMEFIVAQQAQFSANIQVLKEQQAENARQIRANSAQIEANSTRVAQLVDVCMSLARHSEETEHNMKEGFREVKEIQAHTEYKLNALIETVDKIVQRNGGHGKS
ncbi:MAG: hypothetical protein ACRD19_15300 [Terriglobia bacterium]